MTTNSNPLHIKLHDSSETKQHQQWQQTYVCLSVWLFKKRIFYSMTVKFVILLKKKLQKIIEITVEKVP